MAITEEQMERLLDIFENASRHISNISHGGSQQGPLGFEALTMAIAGEGTPGICSLVDAIDAHGDSVETAGAEIAKAIDNLAKAVASLKS